MAAYRTLDDLDVAGQRVLVRCDLNVPMQDGKVSDATRIERTAPTLKELAEKGARVVVLSHFGRPKGKPVPEMSLAPIATPLSGSVGRPVGFLALDDAEAGIAGMADGDIVLVENVRYEAGEEANDAAFARQLAALGDIYVNDAFSCSHRAHASTEGLAHLLPSAAGRSMEAELKALDAALSAPERPVAALVGGAKVSTKLAVLGHLLDKVDVLIIGGGMANTFLHARGVEVGASLCEADMADTAREIMTNADKNGCEIMLPVDVVVAHALEAGVDTATIAVEKVPAEMMILDVGPRTAIDLCERLATCKTVLWNGPLGAFEVAPFDAGTNEVAKTAAGLTRDGTLVSVAGGGDTVAALRHAGVMDSFTYVSTAGGAFLEWLEGKTLPGVAALSD